MCVKDLFHGLYSVLNVMSIILCYVLLFATSYYFNGLKVLDAFSRGLKVSETYSPMKGHQNGGNVCFAWKTNSFCV